MLVGDKARQMGSYLSGELDGAVFGGLKGFAGLNRGDDANDSTVGAVGSDRVGDHVKLGDVFVGNAAAVSLIPIDDELLALAVADEIFADLEAFAVDVLDVDVLLGVEGPAGAGQTVLRRVHGLPGALGGEVPNEEADRRGSLRNEGRWWVRTLNSDWYRYGSESRLCRGRRGCRHRGGNPAPSRCRRSGACG